MHLQRILLVDDHVLFRKGIAALIQSRPDMTVLGEAGDGLEAVTRARETHPDVILMDIGLPGCDGLEATRLIKKELPNTHVVMLSVSDDDQDLFNAIKAGAEGYLLKDAQPQELYGVLEALQRGEIRLSGPVAARILTEFVKPSTETPENEPEDPTLTPRELEVLQELARGSTNKEIATTLQISENTVKIHLRNILEKLHLKNRTQAVAYAVQNGLVRCEVEEAETER
ncbi:response regulator [Limnochorda pilosa]|uniref:Chemotaxis protein CheY n=1 Tax=Limnochorda pilosa TaxID=1555112 RepID=A0A0K2SGC8_LIMPI|nr:response regulator transcription factor [Limnochorda pilosa]BAS26148.1 chemotaxis protein CheY [Limnochorda pilosa]